MFLSVFSTIPPGFTTLEPPRKGVIEKMTYLSEFWLILESELVDHAPHGIFVVWI
jgi:hypothetical protein